MAEKELKSDKKIKESDKTKVNDKVKTEKKVATKKSKTEKSENSVKPIKETKKAAEASIDVVEKELKKDKKVAKDEKPEVRTAKLTPKKFQHGKNHRKSVELIERGKDYSIDEAIVLIKKTSQTKFDSTVEIHVNLNVDPSSADHQVRGSVSLPAGLGKAKKVCAIVSADKEKEAKDAGAETVGGQDIIAKIEKGWLDFEVLVATPDMMGFIGKIGKTLGTKGLMPNPKSGTVTNDPGKVITDIKKGRAEYKIDKQGSLHSAVGKVSFKEEDLKKNLEIYLDAVHHAKPASLKGTFIKSIYLTTTMGPSIKLSK